MKGVPGVLERAGATFITRRGHDHGGHFGIQGGLALARRRAQEFAVGRDRLLEVCLIYGRMALVEQIDGVAIDVHTDHVKTPAGDRRGHAGPQLAETYDRISCHSLTQAAFPSLPLIVSAYRRPDLSL